MTNATDYRKSSFSLTECVEARPLPDGSVQVRNSTDPDTAPHTFTRGEWVAFVAGVKQGEFDFGVDIGAEQRQLVER